MTAATDPLSQLLVDGAEVDRQALASALMGLVSIDTATGRPMQADSYAALGSRKKVLAILLACKAAHLLTVRDGESIANKQIVELSGLPPGTVAPSLKDLRKAHLVAQEPDKSYYVPNGQIKRAIAYVGNGGAV